MADLTNMLTVIFTQDPSEYKKAGEQVTDYEDALKTYENAIRKLDDAKKRHKKLTDKGECDWYIFNRNGSLDFVNLRTNSENLEKLNTSFSSLFVVIAIMVIFASLSRMVYEQRRQVGVSKALGMRNGEIFSKYLIFGISASILGIFFGILLSLYVIEFVIALGYEDHFVFGRFPFAMEYLPTIFTVIVAVMTALISIYASCSQLLKETAKSLLSPVVPRGISKAVKKSSFLSKLNLYNRMIILNMRSDIVRVCVTIISVAGCCSLVVIGFTLKQNISGAITTQMAEISRYDAKVGYNSILSETVEDEIEELLKSKNTNYMRFLDKHGSIKIDDTMEYVEFLITDDIRHLSDFQTLQDWNSGNLITSSGDGIIITNRVSELYHLNIGDSIDLIDDLGYTHAVRITGITRNFIGRYAILSKSFYQELLDDEFSDNTFFFTCDNKAVEKEIESALDEIVGFETYAPVSELMDMFENLLIVLNLIIWLLIVLAGVMAMFVLLNLADMYLMSKRTELTIMRINGFTVKETIVYAIREVIFTSILGIIFGVIFGSIIVYSILRNMEQAHLMFVRTPSIPSCILGAAITAIFISGIYAFSMRKVKDLNLTNL